jgi:uncharacterized membrane protein
MEFIDVISRWVHVGAAIVLLGGSTFIRFVLMPSAELLPEAEHQQLRQAVMGRWKRFVMIGIGLLLASGLYNYGTSGRVGGLYHGLMGIKMLLAVGVFFLASALTGRSARLAAIRKDAKKWLIVLIVMAASVVAIGGFLKVAVSGG